MNVYANLLVEPSSCRLEGKGRAVHRSPVGVFCAVPGTVSEPDLPDVLPQTAVSRWIVGRFGAVTQETPSRDVCSYCSSSESLSQLRHVSPDPPSKRARADNTQTFSRTGVPVKWPA